MDLKLSLQLCHNMGARYTGYRLWHEVEKRTVLLEKKHPTASVEDKFFLSLAQWRKTVRNSILPDPDTMEHDLQKKADPVLQAKAEKILKGEIQFFSKEWKDLGRNYNWITNPMTGYEYDLLHWTKINDFDASRGDIKDVWEKSRFTHLLTIMRYDCRFKKDNSAFVFSEIESWIDNNPVNKGPNWKCSQEISLRLFNWCFVLDFYKNSSSLTENLWKKIQNVLYWSLHHVYQNINFSRIAVRNNHAITETLCLALSELFFPFIPETKKWAKQGRKWFEKEIEYQIYKDGTFLQFSMNYHRVAAQLLSLALSVSERHQKPFSGVVYDRAYKSLNFLYQCLQEEDGYLPNYGNNDGAWFFPLSDTEYRDYRPQLNTLHQILTGSYLYENIAFKEDFIGVSKNKHGLLPMLNKQFGAISFQIGGYYLLREASSFTFIRCGNHKDRPAQADNLHLDIWKEGKNVLYDAGTYKYNTTQENQKFFAGTASHNTVGIENYSQMQKGSRFLWFYWSQAKYAFWEEKEDRYVFKGAISAFRHLNKNIEHHREIIKYKNVSRWEITDCIKNNSDRLCYQQWHFNSASGCKITTLNKKTAPISIPSYHSSFYGEKIKGTGISFPFRKNLTTNIKID